MNLLAQDYRALLEGNHEPPCLSLYQPTHRHHPENAQDAIRFRNLLKEMAASLQQKYPKREIQALLQPFEELAADAAFWNCTTDGLAVLGAPGLFRVYRLPRPVAELVVVADSFHTKPLVRVTQSADRYQVLGLSRHGFKMFEGNRDGLNEVAPREGVSQTISEKLGKEVVGLERERTNRAYGPAGRGFAAQHGTDVRQDADDRDTTNFFRAVAQTVFERYSRPSGLPLILAALPEHHHLFRSVSDNRFLIDGAIDVHPDDLSLDALRERSWQLMLPYYLDRLAGFVDAFGTASANGNGTDNLADIAEAAIAGRVATLLIEADRLVPGRLDAETGKITTADLSRPDVDDVLDDLGERVLKAGGDIVIVPAERMPTTTGAAAIYRF